ncbi:MAG: FprA family A-type flavoprotein [bacterium]
MVTATAVAKDIFWVGALNPDLRWFDVVMHTPHGTTYNAYLILGEKIALVEQVHARFTDVLIDNIRQLIDPAKIDYLIVNHTEMDHTGALVKVLDLAPNAQVVSTKVAATFLKKIVNREFRSIAVGDGDTLSLGNKTLQFISVPYWHWPDTMFTYLVEDKTLFPCDGFAAHYCDERLFNDLVPDYTEDFKYYYDSIMRPFRPKIAEGVEKIKDLDINLIGTSHGPIVRTDPRKYIQLYTDWAKSVPAAGKKNIVIFYVSAYGNTKKMAEEIAATINDSNIATAKLIDAKTAAVDDVRSDLESANGIIFGSPTFTGDALKPVWDIISLLGTVSAKGKPVAAFGSYGWSGEAVSLLEERLKGMKMKVAIPGLKANFVPNQTELDKCREFGKSFMAKI